MQLVLPTTAIWQGQELEVGLKFTDEAGAARSVTGASLRVLRPVQRARMVGSALVGK